jgi:hypothetical protein
MKVHISPSIIEQARDVGDRRRLKIESAAGAVFPAIKEQE